MGKCLVVGLALEKLIYPDVTSLNQFSSPNTIICNAWTQYLMHRNVMDHTAVHIARNIVEPFKAVFSHRK